MEAIMFFALR